MLKNKPMDIATSNLLSIIAFIASISTIIIGWRKGGAEMRKADADAGKIGADTVKTYAQMAMEIAEKYRELDHRFDVLSENIDTVNNYVGSLLFGIDLLISQLTAAGTKPAWTPPPKPKLRDTGELKAK